MSFPSGIANINNLGPEVPVQALEDFLSTPMFNLIHSFGVDLYHAEAYLGRTTRMSRFERLNTDGGQLDGSGIDPAPEVPQRTDIDAKMEIFAKSIVVNEQVKDHKTACYKFLVKTLESLKALFAHGNQRQAVN